MNRTLSRIRDYQKKSRARYLDRVYVVEGKRLALEAPEDMTVMTVVSDTYAESEGLPEGALRIRDTEFERISDTKTPQGILKVVRMPEWTEEEIICEEDGLILLLENLQDPGNLGTILRTAEACSVSGIIMNRGTVDVFNPKVIRGSMGSVFRVRFAFTEDLCRTVRRIRETSGRVYAAHLKDSLPCTSPDYTKKTAFLIGNEGNGLTDDATASADACIHIPMGGKVESLNAAVAATVLSYEAVRQRSLPKT